MSSLLRQWKAGTAERQREYIEGLSPERTAELILENRKIQKELRVANAVLKGQKIKAQGSIEAAQISNRDNLTEALINASAKIDAARVSADASKYSAYVKSTEDFVYGSLGFNDSKTASQVRTVLFSDEDGYLNQVGARVATEQAGGASLNQSVDKAMALERTQAVISAVNKELGAEANAGVRARNKNVAKAVIVTNLTQAITDQNPDLDYMQVQSRVNQIISARRDFELDDSERQAAVQNAELGAQLAEQHLRDKHALGVNKNYLDLVKKQIAEPDLTPQVSFDDVEGDPALTKAVADIEEDITNLRTPAMTEFGQFMAVYRQSPEKVVLNRIIGVDNDKTAGYIYHHNPEIMFAALEGLKEAKGTNVELTADSTFTEEDVNFVRNTIAKQLGVRYLGKNVNPKRLQIAMNKRGPIQFDPSTQKQIERIEASDPTEEDVQKVEASTTEKPKEKQTPKEPKEPAPTAAQTREKISQRAEELARFGESPVDPNEPAGEASTSPPSAAEQSKMNAETRAETKAKIEKIVDERQTLQEEIDKIQSELNKPLSQEEYNQRGGFAQFRSNYSIAKEDDSRNKTERKKFLQQTLKEELQGMSTDVTKGSQGKPFVSGFQKPEKERNYNVALSRTLSKYNAKYGVLPESEQPPEPPPGESKQETMLEAVERQTSAEPSETDLNITRQVQSKEDPMAIDRQVRPGSTETPVVKKKNPFKAKPRPEQVRAQQIADRLGESESM
tara:strand:- start:635 stop:2836 length:2202 start_codon:yes stop_codon:yes gene_type:complete